MKLLSSLLCTKYRLASTGLQGGKPVHGVCCADALLRRVNAPDTRAGGGAPAMGSRLSPLATCGFGVRTSFEPAKLPLFGGYSLGALNLGHVSTAGMGLGAGMAWVWV